MPPTKPVRVVIVDDDEWIRRGRADALRDIPGIEVIAILDHRGGISFGGGWDDVDVALVDARDDNEAWDKFPGVSVVEAIRARRGPEQTTVVVITGHLLNDLLRLRMFEAGADFFYSHDEVRTVEHLATVIQHPSLGRRAGAPATERLTSSGLTPASTPNAALAYISKGEFQDMFTPESQKALPYSRRTILRVRRTVARLAGLEERADRPPPPRNASTATWRSVVRFVNEATGNRDNPERAP